MRLGLGLGNDLHGQSRGGVFGGAGFVTQWKTDNAGTSNNDTIILPLISSGTYDFVVDWGDGSSDTITAWDQAEVTHTYSSAGTYTVEINGQIEGWQFANGGDKGKILEVNNWGGLVINNDQAFYGCSNMTTVDASDAPVLSGLIRFMFRDCSSLTTLDVSGFNTSSVTDMSLMFRDCSSLTTLDVSGFNTSNVTNMRLMFFNCSSLTTLDVSGFNTSSVTDMRSMFYNCSSLTTLDVSGFNTANVTPMDYMFYNCSSLTTLDVSGFNTSSVTDMNLMFYNCTSLTTLDVSEFNTASVTNMNSMFRGCSALTTLDVSGFNTQNVTDMRLMFSDCSATDIDPSGFDITSVTDLTNFMLLSGMTTANYDNTLINWEAQAVNDNLSVDFGSSQYTSGSAAETARTNLINDHTWTITDGGSI